MPSRACSSSACTSCCSASTASTTTSSTPSACRTRRSSGVPTSTRSTAKRRCSPSRWQVAKLIRVHRVRGHLIADLDPLHWKEPQTPVELDPATYGLTIWDLDREFLTDGVGGHDQAARSATCSACCATRTAARSASSTCTSRTPTSRPGSSSHVEVKHAAAARKQQKDRILERLNAAEAFEKFLATKYVGTKRFGIEGAESAIPILDEILSGAADDRARRRRHRHGPPRPAQRAVQHHGQELRGDLLRVRRARRPVDGAGLRRRQVPPRRDRQVREPVGCRHQGRAGRQPEPPRDGRPDRDGHRPRPAGPDRAAGLVLGAAAPDPRRRRVRRPGHRRRVPGDERHRRLPGRRHDPPHHQQPDRLHHGARDEPLVVLLLRRRQDDPGADLPRQRRRPGGVRARRPAGVGVPPDVPQGRRDRHGVLPPLRPQRGRRPELHAAADVQGDRRAPQRAQAVRRDARQARRHHRRRGRAGAVRLPGQAPGRARRDRARARPRRSRCRAAQAARRAAAHRDRRRSWRRSTAIFAPAHRLPGGLHAAPQAGQAVRGRAPAVRGRARRRLGHRRGAGDRFADPRGPPGPARRPGLPARHVQPTPRRARRLRDRRAVDPARRPRRRRGQLLGVRLAAVRVRRARLRVRLRPRQHATRS